MITYNSPTSVANEILNYAIINTRIMPAENGVLAGR